MENEKVISDEVVSEMRKLVSELMKLTILRIQDFNIDEELKAQALTNVMTNFILNFTYKSSNSEINFAANALEFQEKLATGFAVVLQDMLSKQRVNNKKDAH